MNLKVLLMILIYYGFISLMFVAASVDDIDTSGYEANTELNESEFTNQDIDKGGFFTRGVDFFRFLGFIFFGITLGFGFPIFISIIFGVIQSTITIFTVGWVLSAVWNG